MDPKLDGIEELERQQIAEQFEIPDRGPTGGFDIFGDDGMSPGRRGGGTGEERMREARTLEDLYVIYPELGNGDWKLRVERLSPRQFRGRSTSGYLGDFYERMSMDDFSERFGGGQYKLAVMKPVPAGDTVSKSDYKQVKELRIVVPGEPSLAGIPTGADDEVNAMNPSVMMVGRPSDAVEIARINAEQREKERDRQEKKGLADRLDAERQRAMEAPRETLAFVSNHTQRAFDDLKEHSQQQIGFWQGEVERLRGELNIRDAELREARLALTRAETEASNTNRVIETASMREMKERHDERYGELKERTEEERRRMQEEHARKLEEIQRDHRRQVEELTTRHAEERRTYESAQALERERLREETRARVEAVEKSRTEEIRALKDTFEGRLDDVRTMTTREVDGIRETSRREIEAIRQSERASAVLTKETSEVRSDLMKSEMEKLRGEAASLRAESARKDEEIRRLIAAQHKPLPEALAEARQTASLVGMVDASEIPSSDGPWYKDAIAIGQRLVESAPEIFKEISKAREANRAQAAQRPPTQQQHMVVQQQGPPQQMAPQRYAPPAPQIIAPPAESSYTPPPLGGATVPRGAPVPIGPVVHQVASPLQPGGDRTAAPLTASEDGDGAAPPEADSGAPATAQQPQAPAVGGAGGENDELVGRFFKMLEDSVRERVVTAEMFAQGFISQVGRETAAQLVQQFSPDVIIDVARRSTNGQSRIVTREGQRYVREMVGHVQRLAVAPAAVA